MPILPLDHPEPSFATLGVMLYPATDEADTLKARAYVALSLVSSCNFFGQARQSPLARWQTTLSAAARAPSATAGYRGRGPYRSRHSQHIHPLRGNRVPHYKERPAGQRAES
jgi:hypothetical protein